MIGQKPHQRSKQAMNAHWKIQHSIAAAKNAAGQRAPVSREEEIAAIERHLAEKGATKLDPVYNPEDPKRNFPTRTSVMAGWR